MSITRRCRVSCALRCCALAALLLAGGCSDGEGKKKTMPANSPTRSVEAAEAYNQGTRLRKTDKPGAIAAYTRAVQADPKFEFAYYNRALTLAEELRIEEARKDLDTLKRLGSERAGTLEALINAVEDLAKQQQQQKQQQPDPSASRPSQ